MAHSVSVLSTEYVETVVTSLVDPTGDVVQLALPTHDTVPVTGDWKTGVWRTATINGVTTRYAGLLVGPGANVYTAGVYDLWVKITDSPEVPVTQAGQVRFT